MSAAPRALKPLPGFIGQGGLCSKSARVSEFARSLGQIVEFKPKPEKEQVRMVVRLTHLTPVSEAHDTTPIRNSGYPKPGGYHL